VSRPQTQKFARIPENVLLDRIFQCFKEFNYWPMKAFRARLQQPETYLKETLEKCAVLAKSGRFASMWSLKPEIRQSMKEYDVAEDSFAPSAEGVGDEDSDMADGEDGDDEDIKFEDVVS
jgi:transcription initiation factor TFIIF subunit beta